MQEQNNQQPGKAQVGYTNPGEGPQGVDKAPGEETAASTDNTIKDAQKGKQKVDADLDNSSDRPAKQP